MPKDPQNSDPGRAIQLPGDYYSTPVTAPPLVPSWLSIGCGAMAIAFLVILFSFGALVSSRGIGSLLDLPMSKLESETERMFASDVAPPQRAAFTAEMHTLRANIRAQKVDLRLLQPVMDAIGSATSDKLVNAAETGEIMTAMRKANEEAAKAKPPQKR